MSEEKGVQLDSFPNQTNRNADGSSLQSICDSRVNANPHTEHIRDTNENKYDGYSMYEDSNSRTGGNDNNVQESSNKHEKPFHPNTDRKMHSESQKESPTAVTGRNRFIFANLLPSNSVKKLDLLGNGAFGQVYKGEWGDRQIAIKEIDVELAKKKLELSENEVLEAMEWEISRMSTVSHPNLVQFYGIWINPDNNRTCMIMEYCGGGTLEFALEFYQYDLPGRFGRSENDWSMRLLWAWQITCGLVYLHQQGIIHRDLKAENILLDEDKFAKLADLGVAQVDALLQQTEAAVVAQGLQDSFFKAPETYGKNAVSYKASDIFALGLVFWQICVGGTKPRRPRNKEELELWLQNNNGEREHIPDACPPEFKTIILKCWKLAPGERPTAEQLQTQLEVVLHKYHNHSAMMIAYNSHAVFTHTKYQQSMPRYLPTVIKVLDSTEMVMNDVEDIEKFWQKYEELSNDEEFHWLIAERGWGINHVWKNSVPDTVHKFYEMSEKFLSAQDSRAVILCGEGGIGKTVTTMGFAEDLLRQWKRHIQPDNTYNHLNRPKSNNIIPYFPIIVGPALVDWPHSTLKSGLQTALRFYNLENIPRDSKLLVIIDDYDQCLGNQDYSTDIYDHLGMNEFPASKLLLTCRPHFLTQHLPRLKCRGSEMLSYMLPFSFPQITEYLYARWCWTEDTFKMYFQMLKDSRKLVNLLRSPQVLELFSESFEYILQRYNNNLSSLTRAGVYKCSIEHWMEINGNLLSETVQKQLQSCSSLPSKSLLESFWDFATTVAVISFHQDTPLITTESLRRSRSLETIQSSRPTNMETPTGNHSQLHQNSSGGTNSSPYLYYHWINLKELVKQDAKLVFQNKVSNSRRSLLQEFDYETIMINRLTQFENSNPLKLRNGISEFSSKSVRDFFIAMKIFQIQNHSIQIGSEDNETLQGHVEELVHLLNNRSIHDGTAVPIINFIKELWILHTCEHLESLLIRVILKSKQNKAFAMAASNAITILNAARRPFSRMDLSEISISGADLSYGIFDGTKFVGADLRGVRFEGAWLRETNFAKALMQGVIFAEYPSLMCEDEVNAIAYSSNGRLAVTAGMDIQIYTENYKLLHRLRHHTGVVTCVSFNSSGTYLVSGAEDTTICLWDVGPSSNTTEHPIHIFEHHTNAVTSICFNTLGTIFVSGSVDGTVVIWDVDSRQLVHTLQSDGSEISSVTCNFNGTLVAASLKSFFHGNIMVWNMESGELLNTLQTKGVLLDRIRFSPVQNLLAFTGQKCNIEIANLDDLQSAHTYSGHSADVYAINFNRSGTMLVSGACDCSVRVWDLEKKCLLHTFLGHNHRVNTVTFHPTTDRLIASGSSDNTVRFCEIGTDSGSSSEGRSALQSLDDDPHENSVEYIYFNSSGSLLASYAYDNNACIWDVHKQKIHHRFSKVGRRSCTYMDESGSTILLASIDEIEYDRHAIFLLSNSTEEALHIFEGHQGRIYCSNFNHDGSMLASGGEDHTVRLWSVKDWQETNEPLHIFEGHEDSVTSACFDHMGKLLASGSLDTTCRLWNTQSGEYIGSLIGHTDCVRQTVFNAAGTTLVTASHDMTFKLWDISKLSAIHTSGNHSSWVWSVALNPTETLIASTDHNTLRLWDVRQLECCAVVEGFGKALHSVAFSPNDTNGLFFAVGGEDGSVRYFEIDIRKVPMQAHLIWSAGQSVLTTFNACIEGVTDISETNVALMIQRGAIRL